MFVPWASSLSHLRTLRLEGVFHDQGPLFCSTVEPSETTPVSVTIRCYKDEANSADVVVFDNSDSTSHTLNMRKIVSVSESLYDYWQATIPASNSQKNYRFKLSDGNSISWYNCDGASRSEQTDRDFLINPGFKTPQWLKDGVIYQIFPDRFANGDTSNDIQTGAYRYAGQQTIKRDWGQSPIPDAGQSASMIFFGGDLNGVAKKLSYIRSNLGADIIYLNPIFRAPSNHKYDTSDYQHVDPAFGTDQTLVDLSAQIHREVDGHPGYLLLDGVFNHTGDSHTWFAKYAYDYRADKRNSSGPGAYQSKNSVYSNYYTFFNWPNKFATFLDAHSLPKLNYGSQSVKDEIYAKPDSIALRYLKPPFNIDGWRLDAPQYVDANGNQGSDETNHSVWREFRQATKSCKPDAAILGEYWDNAAAWTADGDQWDCATNFDGFTQPVSEWITGRDYENNPAKLSASQFDLWLSGSRAHYPTNVQQSMSNHLSNHDITRFAERAGGDISKLKLALIFQMSYIGVPTIYYGDEYGMQGGKDPDDRRTFDWSQVRSNNPTIEFVHKLISIRQKYAALRQGSFITLDVNDTDNTYAFGRMDDHNKIAVVLNNDDQAHRIDISAFKLDIADSSQLVDELSGNVVTIHNGHATLDLPARSGMILVAR
jgi:alpha-glucosidase